jgi:threonyl-tRNA synthetase
MDDEISEVLRFSLSILRTFGFEKYKIYLSTRPDGSVGEEQRWLDAEAALRRVIEESGLPFQVDEGGGAFYGPKIDLKVEDAMGREWQLSTIQFDFNLPERFDMTYIGDDGQEHQPYMVHRALLGAWERFFGLLIEHYAGAFPVWLSPVQVKIIPVADRHNDYCREIEKELRANDIRVEVDDRSERMNQKIRQAQLEKIPYMLIIGDKEVESSTVSVRLRTGEQTKQSLEEFRSSVREAIDTKATGLN